MSTDKMLKTSSFKYYQRKWFSHFMAFLFMLMSLLSAVPFFFIFYYVCKQGLDFISWEFFTRLPAPAGEKGGGMSNAVLGSAVIVGLSALAGVPWGLGLGFYLSEYKDTKTARILKFVIDLLLSAPSIVIGIFIYGSIVFYFGFSAYAGSAALLLIMLPVTAKGTEEILKLTPISIREAGLALGIPRWKTLLFILAPGVFSMLITVILLALARIAGETAPLLFTSLGNEVHISSLSEPTASLPVQIYEYSKSGFEQLEGQAWAGALALVGFVFLINLLTRIIFFFYKKPV